MVVNNHKLMQRNENAVVNSFVNIRDISLACLEFRENFHVSEIRNTFLSAIWDLPSAPGVGLSV